MSSDARTFTMVKHEGELRCTASVAHDAFVASVGDGEALTVTYEPEAAPKTRLQEKGFHSMISPLAKHYGWELDDLKQYLLGEIFGWRDDPNPLTGARMLNEPHTSKLSKTKYSELIERTLDIAATKMDFTLIAPDEYRQQQYQRRAS